MKEHVLVDYDEVIPHGTVKMSANTLRSLELEPKDSGHHVGEVAFIHRLRHDANERIADQDAQWRHQREFGYPNQNALQHYRAKGEYPIGHQHNAAPARDVDVLTPTPGDTHPNDLSLQITAEGTKHLAVHEPVSAPYPTSPLPPEPTQVVDENGESAYVAPPATPAEEEHDKEEWLRKEREAQGQAQGQ